PSTLMLERQARAVDGQRIAELRELQAGSEVMARSARDLASHSMQVFAAKPRIGVYVDLTARDTDKYGAYVNAVTPGGPAAKAGVRTGDIITRIAGKSLTAPDSIRRGVDESAPGLRLIEVVSRLEAGKAVPLEVRRGNDSRKLTITPDDDQSMAYFVDGVPVAGSMAPAMRGGTINNVWAGRMMPTPEGAAEAPLTARFFENFNKAGADGRYSFVTAFGTALADLELAPINEKLGSYFGVTEGVLVIDVPEKANLGLVPGDVVTAVDGRKVSTPSQLMRVLATYDKGDEFKLQVTRQKRQETVSAKQP
ncbi:MAG: PDZ domain-containing protein, partial [Gemmatimonadota bacterium]